MLDDRRGKLANAQTIVVSPLKIDGSPAAIIFYFRSIVSLKETNDRSKVEDYCRGAAIDFQWRDDNGLRIRQLSPAVVEHPQTGELVFFNQIQLHHISCLPQSVQDSLRSMLREEDFPRNVYYGDGTPIEDSVIQVIKD